jgi:hypothetical protein
MSTAICESTSKARTSLSSASRPRQKSLAGVGHENADTDHAKQCGNDLDHDDGPLRPARTKRHGRPNSQKNSVGSDRIATRLMISGNRDCRIVGRIAVELRFGAVGSPASSVRVNSAFQHVLERGVTLHRSASIPFCLTIFSSFSAAPVGWRSPRSHWLTVPTATFR